MQPGLVVTSYKRQEKQARPINESKRVDQLELEQQQNNCMEEAGT